MANTAFDDNQRQTAFNGQNLTYDVNGNLLSDGQRTYTWNVRNQLVEIKRYGVRIAWFRYDSLGRRILKWENGQTTEYLYDGHNAVQEKQSNTVIPVLTGLGIDQRYARTEFNGIRTYFLTDHLGSTRALTNANGNIVQRYDYTPYGQTIASAAGFNNPYQYTGRELDQSGLYYYRARYYSSQMGRFISEDPIGLAGGLNVYAYVGGNPMSYIDPLGLEGDYYKPVPTPETPEMTAARRRLQSLANAAASNVDDTCGVRCIFPWIRGTLIHSEFKRLVDSTCPVSEYRTEVSYKGGDIVDYGTPGSSRADVVFGPQHAPTVVYDLKTGARGLSWGQTQAYGANLPPGTPVTVIRPEGR